MKNTKKTTNFKELLVNSVNASSALTAGYVISNSPLLTKLKQHGKNITEIGGDPIFETLSFAGNAPGGSYSGFDPLPTAADDGPTAAAFKLSQYAVLVPFYSPEVLVNSSKEELADLFELTISVSSSTMANFINRDIYGDGTGNNNKNLDGLAAMVSTELNTYGGIDRNLPQNAFWRNQVFKRPTLAARIADVFTSNSSYPLLSRIKAVFNGAARVDTIQNEWKELVLKCTRGKDRPDLIIASPAVFAMFENSLTPQRFEKSDFADAGFRALQFDGIDVVFDSTCPADKAYVLNTKYIKFRTHSKRNFVMLPIRDYNKDDCVGHLLWAGNLTCNNAMMQGVWVAK